MSRSISKLLALTTLLGLIVLAALGAGGPAKNVRAQTAASPQQLNNNATIGPLAGVQRAQTYYRLNVPVGATRLVFTMTGGSGDADIYVKRDAVPTTSSWDFRPYTSSSNETVTVNSPQAGTWYVMIRAYSDYSGVFLKASHDAPDGLTAAAPTFSPAPATYSGQVSVGLSSTTTANATIRFTLDGTAPTESSEVYNAPILVTSTTTISARTYAPGYTPSTVTSGTYRINSTLQVLVSGTPVTGLSGATGSVSNYRIAVPSGMSRLTISIAGGTGDADLYAKFGQLATTSVWDQRPYTGGNNETITIDSPRAGDHFVMIHGYRAYSGVTLTATISGTATPGKPDLIAWGPAMNPRITTETFAANSCDVAEGTITAGTKKLLRFTTQSRNIGTADLALGNPANNPAFEWGACHGHYHFRSFASYRLLNTAGAVVRTGQKVGFCLMDITRVSSTANPSARYTCSNQGIQAGWADVYSSNLSGQWIDITGVPAGQYVLEVTMDPMNVIAELDETNNTTRLTVTIP